jgi:hypothetical protein
MARKILTSSANNKKLEYSITLQRLLMNILKSKAPRTDPFGTPKRTSKGYEKVSKMHTDDCRLVR